VTVYVDPDTDRSAMPLLIVFPFLLNILDTEDTEIFLVFSPKMERKLGFRMSNFLSILGSRGEEEFTAKARRAQRVLAPGEG
jgi:hypothetical protein